MPGTQLLYLGLTLGICASGAATAQTYLPDLPIHHPAIQYGHAAVDDPVSRLGKRLESGASKIEFSHDGSGYLPGLLKQLGIAIDSQALVFSRTSFQAAKIGPKNPRAVYFGDDVAVGYVRGGDGFEVAALDPRQGVVFYTFPSRQTDQPVFTRGEVCLKCHQGPATSGVPGFYVGSVIPSPSGAPRRDGAIVTDDRTEFKDRWGGWYVNAIRGEPTDRANAVASDPSDPDLLDTDGQQNRATLMGLFDPKGYLSPLSDIVALMTFEHQTQMINYITRVGWEARIYEYKCSHGGEGADLALAQLNGDVKAMTAYMLFSEAKPLENPIEGVSTFTRTFPKKGPRDSAGRSLRDFDLQTRLFRYPVSYMIYSDAFNALPEMVLDDVYHRLFDALKNGDEKKREALEILRQTRPGLPGYWK